MSETLTPVDLSVRLGPLELPNPVLTASGTFGYALEMLGWTDVSRLGAVVLKTITPEVRPGNPPPRIFETAAGMLNSIGLANDGIDDFLQSKVHEVARHVDRMIVNFAGHRQEEYVDLARELDALGEIMALEMNVSCPNVKGGMDFSTKPEATERLVTAVRKVTRLPLIVKLSPNVTDITAIARAAVNGGADILSLTNTWLGMAIDWRRRRPVLGNVMGGLSGPCIKPLSLRAVYQVARALPGVPLIGIGGIMTPDDVMDYIVAGASAVQVGTATFRDPDAGCTILDGLAQVLRDEGIYKLSDVVGAAHPAPAG